MNDDEIYELMRREADRAPMGDRDDLRRGRARLRRRRLVTGGSGVASVALAATLVGGYLPGSGPGTDPGPANSPDSHQGLEQLADRTGRAITKAMKDHTRIEEFGEGRALHGLLGAQGNTVESSRLIQTYWHQEWHEAGGVGYLQVTVTRGYDHERVPPEWFESCSRRFGGWSETPGSPWPDEYDDCKHRTVEDQPVLVGVEQRTNALWILVKYLRQDGKVVELGFSSPYRKTDAPVLDPSLTPDQLVDVVTDPRVRLYLNDHK
jgi:hypothetical protein